MTEFSLQDRLTRICQMMMLHPVFLSMELKNPTYFVHLLRYSLKDNYFEGDEYEFAGINPEKDIRIYKHHRRIYIPFERLYDYKVINDPRR